MENKTLDELKIEADELGIKYVKNIGAAKLAEKIEAYYESQAADDLPKVAEESIDAEDGEAVEDELAGTPTKVNKKETSKQKFKRESKARQRAAMNTKVVILSNADKRESNVANTTYLSCGTLSRIVPLDEPVELEIALIEVAKSVTIMNHVDEIVDGKRTGNKTPKMVKKFMVSYEEVK